MLNREIKQVNLTPNMRVADLVSALSGCAFGAGRLADAVHIAEEMFSTECTKFFGLAGALVPAGMGNIISDLIKNNYIDVLVTTGANLVHDILESFGLHHYKGIPDIRDVDLKNKKISRIYDVFLPEPMQEFIDICYTAKKTGAFLVGGGVPKNFIMQSMLVTPKSFDYAKLYFFHLPFLA